VVQLGLNAQASMTSIARQWKNLEMADKPILKFSSIAHAVQCEVEAAGSRQGSTITASVT